MESVSVATFFDSLHVFDPLLHRIVVSPKNAQIIILLIEHGGNDDIATGPNRAVLIRPANGREIHPRYCHRNIGRLQYPIATGDTKGQC